MVRGGQGDELLSNGPPDVVGQLFMFEGFLVGGERRCFAAFAVRKNGAFIAPGDGGLQIHPAAVQGAAKAAGRLRFSE